MPQPVFQTPAISQIQNYAVGNAVSGSAHGLRWVNELGFLLGGCLPTATSQRFKVPTGSSGVIRIPYTRSPGAQVVMIAVELHQSSSSAARCTVTTSVTGLAWITANGLDGTQNLIPANGTLRNYDPTIGFADVTGLTVGTTVDVAFTWTDVSNSKGIYSITITEVPLAITDPTAAASTEVSAEAAWPQAGVSNLLIDGTTTYRRGFVRLFGQLDSARTNVKRPFTLTTWENTTDPWGIVAGVMSNLPFGMGSAPSWRIRPQSLYGTNATCILRIRYYTTTNTGTFRCTVTPVGGAGANTDIALTANAGAWTVASVAISLPNTGTGGEVDLTFFGVTTALTAWVSSIAIIPNEA